MRNRWRLIIIAILTLLAGPAVWPQRPGNYIPGGDALPGSLGIHIQLGNFRFDRQGATLGLDLQGGTHLVLQADMSKAPGQDAESVLKGVIQVLERRVNAYGVAEPLIQAQGQDRVIVELPGVKDIEEAKKLIGQTAQLDFRERDPASGEWRIATAIGLDGEEKELTGKYFRPNAQVVFDSRTNQPQVAFEFDDEGSALFEQITRRLIQRPLGIFLDNIQISAPTVQAVISRNGVITGLRLNEARTLAIQLNAGAVPVPISIIEERTVDATLGSDSVRKSIVAGEIALLVVALFMVLYYRLPGLLATAALLIYTVLTLAVFKLIPVTLTLAGIAGFILSIGMAVDANILIFERLREELRWGKSLGAAIQAGFDRAWSSIRDSNTSTLITCVLLYWFGQNFGASLIMGFAFTLAIGVLISLFSAIFVTRSLLQAIIGSSWTLNPALFGMAIPDPRLARGPAGRLRIEERGTGALGGAGS
ncbi:MAG TPA: protein translocase subunit SecD [Chloroflexota bacterium]|nr:protein translocase subunit SecD [Chloroflexota bacterium]